jgi:hypothetical protein
MKGRGFVLLLALLLPLSALAQQSSSAPSPAIFTPPSGWTPSPELESQRLGSVWRKGTSETIAVTPFAIPATPSATMGSMMAQQFRSLGAKVQSSQTTLCGSAATLQTVGMPKRGSVLEMVLELSHNTTYMVAYSRPAGAAADPAATAFLHNACPSSADSIALLAGPPGWTLQPQMRIAGAWTGRTFGETIMEITSATNDPIGNLMRTYITQANNNGKMITATAKPGFSACGHPADEATYFVSSAGVKVHTDVVATQANGSAYLLTYTTFQPSFDPKVVAAMHAFCPA